MTASFCFLSFHLSIVSAARIRANLENRTFSRVYDGREVTWRRTDKIHTCILCKLRKKTHPNVTFPRFPKNDIK